MAEYIKKDELLKFKADVYDEDGHVLYAVPTGCIVAMPPADVSPVRHGRWILERKPDGKPYCFHCSVCDDDFHYIGITVAYDYCPNCGADMRGEEVGNANMESEE